MSPPVGREAEEESGEEGARGTPYRAGGPATLGPMTKWEYLTAPLVIHNTKMILDNFGDQGWELVQVVPGPDPEQLVAYFKREKA